MRKEREIIVNDRGRELHFTVREMPATKLESWIIRAGLLLAGTGLAEELFANGSTPDAAGVFQAAGRIASQGSGVLTALGCVDYEKARPLLDELLSCCTLKGDVMALTPDLADGKIEDVRTLFALRKEALKVNFDFFDSASQSKSQTMDGSMEGAHASSKRKISVHSQAC